MPTPVNLQNATLRITAGEIRQFPSDPMPQIALCGRSNVGKSSLINSLLNRKNLARVSSAPGKTITINFYDLDRKLFLVDLPGYGFAKRSREDKEKWSALTDGYFTNNPHIDRLCAAVQLVDSRLGLTADDEAMVTFLRGNDIPFFAVATKVDKLNATERRENLAAIAAHPLLTGVQVIPFSALRGFHCHIGSQIFDRYPFVDAARIMIDFMASVRTATGFVAHELNLGGGLGVPYTEYDRTVDYAAVIRDMGDEMRAICRERDFPLPHVILEPGRSLVAAAGITLYTVGSVKTIPGFRTYVSVDGGMPDNPRYALYQSQYTALIANRPDAEQSWRVTLAGRCCESGDLIGENLPLQPTARGDILAVLTTGAYNYSMASNYNRLPRPALVMIRDGKPFVAVRRETYEDVVRNDVF